MSAEKPEATEIASKYAERSASSMTIGSAPISITRAWAIGSATFGAATAK